MVSGAHIVDIEYQAGYSGAGSGLLSVWIDGSVILQYAVSDSALSSIFANNTAYFGFAASTGTDSTTGSAISADTYVYNISVYTNLLSPVYTQVALNAGASAVVTASSAAPSPLSTSTAAINVRAYDFCNKSFAISAGTLSATLRSSVTGSGVGGSSVVNWKNGSYSVYAWYTVAASSYVVALSNNNRAFAASPYSLTVAPGPVFAPTSTYVSTSTIQNLTAGATVTVYVTLRDQYSNPNSTANLGFTDLEVVINNPGTGTSNYVNGTNLGGAVYAFSVSTTVASRLGANGAPITGAIYVTLFGANVINSPVTGVLVVAAAVNPASCSLSGNALISITAGTTSTVTLTPNDVYGNPVLTQVNGTLQLLGSSTGTPVSATTVWLATSSSSSTPTLVYTFTPTIVDTYVLHPYVGPNSSALKLVPASQMPTVIASSVVTASTSYFYGVSNGTAGSNSSYSGVTFSIQSCDPYGNHIVNANGASYIYTVSVTVADASPITANCVDSGTPAPAASVSTSAGMLAYSGLSCVYSQSSSTYSVKLVAYIAQQMYTVAVTMNGQAVPVLSSSRSTFSVVPANPDALHSTYDIVNTSLAAGATGYLHVLVADMYGNVRTGFNDTAALWLTPVSFQSLSSSGGVKVSINGLTTSLDGNYYQSFMPIIAASYTSTVQLSGMSVPLTGSVSVITVIPGAFVPSRLQVSGTGTTGGVTGAAQTFTLLPYDGYGNRLLKNLNPNVTFVVDVSTSAASTQGTIAYVADSSAYQSYLVTYIVPAYTQSSGNNALTITVYQSPSILCLTLVGEVLIPATDNVLTTLPSTTYVAGSVSTVTVVPRDSNGVVQSSTDTFALTLLGSGNYTLVLANYSCVNPPLGSPCRQWAYLLRPTVTGSFQMQVKVITATNVSESLQSQSRTGLALTVTPAAVSAAASTLTALNSTTLVAGTPFYFTVQACDTYGNLWTTSPGAVLQVSSSLTETASYGPLVVDNNDGTYTVVVAYTTAGTRLVNVTINNGAVGSGFQLAYTAAAFSGSQSSINTITSTDYLTRFQAGSSALLTITALDAYSNALSGDLVCAVTFVRAYDGASVTFSSLGGETGTDYATAAAQTTQGAGIYVLTTSAITLADYTANLSVSVSCGSSSPSSVISHAYNLIIHPAALSDLLSNITNWPTYDVTAASTVTLSLSLFDIYGNQWAPFDSTAPRGLFSAVITRDTLLNVNSAVGIAAAASGAPGVWLVSYAPTLASTSWSFVFVDDQSTQHTFGYTTFTVVAQSTPAAGKTTLSPQPLSQSMVAGVVQTITVQFADLYGNSIAALLLNSSLDSTAPDITAHFYYRNPTSYCLNGAIDTSVDVTAHFISSGLLLSADESSIQLNFTAYTVDTYFLMLYVDGVAILSSCSSLPSTLGFAVVHAPVYLPGSLVTSTTAGELRAGAALSFSVQLVDAFNNSISDLSTNTTLTPPDATAISPCEADLPVFSWDGTIDTISAPIAGAFTIGVTGTVAGQYVLPFTLDGELVGSVDACPTMTIMPSYLYSFARGAEDAVVAGVQSNFDLAGVDVYNNAISAADLTGTFTATYTYDGTASQPPLSFTATSSQVSSATLPIISYYADLNGNYSVTISIPADPSDPSGHVPTPLSYTLSVQSESCAAETGDATLMFRCADNTCVSSYSLCAGYVACPLGSYYDANANSVCLNTYPTVDLCPAGLQLCALPSTSPNATYLLAANSVNFYCAVACPTGWLSDRYPVDCGNGVARQSLADCPSAHVCPFTYTTCPDGSCVASGDSCSSSAALLAAGTACAASGLVQCRDGRCVDRAENCGTERTCPHPQVLCADGSCQASVNLCPNEYACALTDASYLCATGECRASADDCPSQRVCPVSYVLCPGGECASTLATCNQNSTTCASGQVRCVDGSCRVNHLQCPTVITCPSTTPVHCADNSCAADVALCPQPPACATPTPFVCPDGTCSANATTCSSGITCPPSAPVLCADNSCAVSLSNCGVALTCPSSSPIRCSDGACKGSYTDCSSTLLCPTSIPVRCPDGSCAISILACPQPATQLNCSANQLRCPSGHCALSLSACPTTVSCGTGLLRCADGTCRPTCSDSLALTSYSHCGVGEIVCPRTSGGVTCAPLLSQCPTEITCASSTPVRCVDNSCAQSSADCPAVSSLISNQYLTSACVGGGWKDSPSTCGTSVTCPPFAPVKCWDESCRVQAVDCPPQLACTFGTTNAASFLCPDGSCVSTPSACTSLIQCTYPQVKCPSDTAGGAGIFCVADSSQCINLYNQTAAAAVCPNSFTRCRGGNCMPSVQSCPSWNCPTTLPYLCPSGVCVVANASCPVANGCPASTPYKCWDGSCANSSTTCPLRQACPTSGAKRCADGSCTTGSCYSPDDTGCPADSVRCWDKSCASSYAACTDASDLYNACPASRPFRCADGYCAVTRSSCPLFPLVPSSFTACSASTPFLCADGSCVAFGSQCPVIRPCALGTTRCGDGSCRISGACPTINTCPAERPLRCQSGVCVAGLVSALTVYVESSTTFDPNCIDESTRDGLTAGVQDSRGCPRGWQKCMDGTCASRCSVSTAGLGVASLAAYMFPNGAGNGCPASTPVKCFDGSCVPSSSNCSATTGCPASTPVLCADGTCQSSLSLCSSSTSCLIGVRCPTGQCASSFSACSAANNCPVTHPIRCATGQCARFPAVNGWTNLSSTALTSSCPATVTCDSQHGFLCADGTCASHPSACRPLLACPSSSLQYCSFSQTCIPAGDVCAQATATTCPLSSPVLCANGACVQSTRQCMSPYQPNLPASSSSCAVPLIQCFDGSCASSPLTCYQRAYQANQPTLATVTPFDANKDIFNQSCSSVTQFPCSNGLCLWSQTTSTQQLCPPLAACPAAFPLRCPNGSCIASGQASACGATAVCESGVRCDDGSCRPTASQCVARNGCPASTPLFCPGTAASCVGSITDCLGNPFLPALSDVSGPPGRRLLQTTVAVPGTQVCAENCDRDRAAVAQQVAVAVVGDTTIDVSVDSANVVRTQIVIPAGALPVNVSSFVLAPVAVSALTSTVTPFASTVLSTPFSCGTGSSSPFLLNLTVKAAVDLQLPSSSAASTSFSTNTTDNSLTTPCAITTSSSSLFTVAAYTANGDNSTCIGTLELGTRSMALAWNSSCASSADSLAVAGTLTAILSPSYASGFTNGYGASCLCYNLTQSSSRVYGTGSTFCLYVSHSSSSSPYLAAFARDEADASSRCPGPQESPVNNHFLQLTPPTTLALSCTTATSDINAISAGDICLGAYDTATATWSCVYGDYYYRLANPPWTTTAGRATYRMQSPLPSCSAPAYAFIYDEQVVPVPPAGPYCNLWCQYEGLILGLCIGVTVFLLVSAYIIWRLIRYRRKYLENKKENAALSARARHLDEYAGGLGLADEEVNMMANPLVVEMKALDDRIARASKGGVAEDADGEKQLRQIRELEEEKRRMYADLLALREQAKAKQNAAVPVKGPSRASLYIRQQVQPFAPVRLSFDGEQPQGLPSSSECQTEASVDDTKEEAEPLDTTDGPMTLVDMQTGATVASEAVANSGTNSGTSSAGTASPVGYYGTMTNTEGEGATSPEGIAVSMPEEGESVRTDTFGMMGARKKKDDL